MSFLNICYCKSASEASVRESVVSEAKPCGHDRLCNCEKKMLTTRVERRRVRRPREPIYYDFEPLQEWVEEPSCYILRLYLLLDFEEEELKITHDQSGNITVRGRKQVGEYKFARFESSFNVPKDSNLEKISRSLENNILVLTIPKIVVVKPSEEKKEEPVIMEKPKMVAVQRKEEAEPTVPKEKPTIAEEKRKEEETVIIQKTEEPVMKEPMRLLDEMEEKKEEPAALKEESEIVTGERNEEEFLKKIEEKPILPKEGPMLAEEERKESAALIDVKEETMKTEMDTRDRIKEAAAMKKLNEKLEAVKEPNLEERKDAAVPNEMKKEEPMVKEKLTDLAEKNEATQKDKLGGFEREKKEGSSKEEETVTGKPRYRHETEEQEKQPKEQESRKRRWLRNEEDNVWLDWLDSAFIKKVCRNRKLITLALVALSTGFYISRKLRTRG